MDPFFVETVNYWSILLNSNECDDKASLKCLLGNVGESLRNSRDNNLFYHYDSGFVHSIKNCNEPIITFEVHPPRRCFRVIDNFDSIIRFLEISVKTHADLKEEIMNKYQIPDVSIDFGDLKITAAVIISELHNRIPKKDKLDLYLTPYLAYEIYKDAVEHSVNLNYIVDTFRIVDYWDPDKKR